MSTEQRSQLPSKDHTDADAKPDDEKHALPSLPDLASEGHPTGAKKAAANRENDPPA